MPRGLLFPICLALASVSKLSRSHLSICLLRFVSVSVSVSDPLGRAFNRHRDTGPGPHPVICAPRPTALSVFTSFKRHINYSNEVRRDPCSAIRSQNMPQPPARPPLSPRAGRGALLPPSPLPVRARQPRCAPCWCK